MQYYNKKHVFNPVNPAFGLKGIVKRCPYDRVSVFVSNCKLLPKPALNADIPDNILL